MKTAVVLMGVNNIKNMSESTKLVRWGIIGCGDVTEVKSEFSLSKNSRIYYSSRYA